MFLLKNISIFAKITENFIIMKFSIELIGIIVGSIATILGGIWFMLYKAFNLGKTSQRMEEIEKKTSNANCEIHKENIDKIKEQNLPQRIEQIEKKTLQADCKSNSDLLRQHEITFNSIKHCLNSINATLERHDKYFEKIDKRFSDIDKRFSDIDIRFSDIDKRFADIDKRFADINKRFADVNTNIKDITRDVKDLTKDVISIKSFLSTKYKEDIDLVSLKNSPTKLSDLGNQILEEINGNNFINDNKEWLISRLEEEKPRTALDVENSAFIVFVNFCNNEKFDGIKNFIYNSPEYNVKDNKGCDRKYNLSLMDVCFILSIPLRDMYLESHPEIFDNV